MFTSSKEMFLQLNWLPFYQRVQYVRFIFVFKCINNLSSEFYKDIFKPVSEMHDRHARSSSNNNLSAIQNTIKTPFVIQEAFYGTNYTSRNTTKTFSAFFQNNVEAISPYSCFQ